MTLLIQIYTVYNFHLWVVATCHMRKVSWSWMNLLTPNTSDWSRLLATKDGYWRLELYAVSVSYLSSVRRYVHNFPHMLVQGALTSLAVVVNVAIGNSPLHQLCIGLFEPTTTV